MLRFPFINLILFSGVLMGCMQTQNSSSGDAQYYGDSSISPEFASARAIFAENCTPCHQFYSQSESQLISQGLVVGGDSAHSPIYYRLKGSALTSLGNQDMPTNGTLTSDQIEEIKTWIDQI